MADLHEESRNILQVNDVEHCWIPMPDGTRLAARLWLPQGGPCPAILEYIPYRKRDMVRPRDERNHPYFATNGYACLRVDMRGSGDSTGSMPDMYDQCELEDAHHVINWIATQPWCDGNVGMFGTSWGGTASLQAAVNAPAPLKAIIANCATIDRFEDDIHWMGGCLLTDSIEWGATLPAILAAPPDQGSVGEEWMDIWKNRLDNLTFPFQDWVSNTTRGDYWRHGSVRFQANQLSCPILSIGGWSDRYSNSVMRLTRARPDICKGIVGPWGHHYPDHGEPGPGISFQDVALDWWDHWLKNKENDVGTWPSLRLWRREFDEPQNRLAVRNGDWVALDEPAQSLIHELHLGNEVLFSEPGNFEEVLTIPFDLRHGECAGDTGYFGRSGGLPLEQSPDDEKALCFDSEPLESDINLLGQVELQAILFTSSFPSQLACRICEVTPSGQSNLVTRTVIALELDNNLEATRNGNNDDPIMYTIKFPTTAYHFKAGNRIRLALAGSYWPLVWPNLFQSQIQIHTQKSLLSIPENSDAIIRKDALFALPKKLPKKKTCEVDSQGDLKRSSPVVIDNFVCMGWQQPRVQITVSDFNLIFSYQTEARYKIIPGANANAYCQVEHQFDIMRSDGRAKIISSLAVSDDGVGRSWENEITVSWNDEIMLCKTLKG